VIAAHRDRMKFRLLGNSGLRVSEVALGTMTFGEEWTNGTPRDEARAIYAAYRAAGGNFVDTANVYTQGTSERIVGELVADHRASVVIGTKYTCTEATGDANAGGNHRKSMMQAIEASLRRLKTDYIDVYWLHVWDRMTPVDEVMRAFDDLVRQGKVLYVGISDSPAWWVARANTLAELRGWSRFVGLQIEYSLIERSVERELVPMARALGLGIVAWAPLAGGVLSGKYAAGGAAGASGRYQDGVDRSNRAGERVDRITSTLARLSGEIDRTPPQIAIAWMRYRDTPVIPILGARRAAQLEQNLAALDLTLDPVQLAALEDASAIDAGFPYTTYERPRITKLVYGGMRDHIIG
jgi:aryl-alcohol dehydrogenase-like predicted oxidoreductase